MSSLTMRDVAPCADATALSVRLARSRDDLSDAFRLVFESYYNAGLERSNATRIRLTPHHLLPTSEVLIAEHGSTITSTLSMFGDGYLGLPMESMYGQQVKLLRNQGLRLAEIGSLADRRDSPERFINTFVKMGRLLAQVAHARGIDAIVAAVHPRHARIYKRIMGFSQIGDEASCPYANGNPAVALCLKFAEHRGTPLYDQYFGDQIPQHDLMPYHWEPETRRFFRQVLYRDCAVGDSSAIMGYYNWAVITGRLTP
ncbi:N-acyl amino acid synthase FeeM domain-containing protein [Planctomycetaceae bacterium SH139]